MAGVEEVVAHAIVRQLCLGPEAFRQQISLAQWPEGHGHLDLLGMAVSVAIPAEVPSRR